MSTVRIPPTLRAATNGAKVVDVPGGKVREGDLNSFVNAFLNDTDVRHLEALDTPVGEGDTLVLLPAMAGGAWMPART
jgi:molybdopterin synthase sulfur carrier subunit